MAQPPSFPIRTTAPSGGAGTSKDEATAWSPSTMKVALVGSVVAVNLAFMALAGWTLFQDRTQIQARAEVATQNLAGVLEQQMAGSIREIDLALSAIKKDAERQLASGGIQGPVLDAYIRQVHGQTPFLKDIRTVNRQGLVEHGTGLEGLKKPPYLDDRDYFRRLRDQPELGLVISEPLISRVTGGWVLLFARRLNGPGGAFAGLVLANISLDSFSRAYSLLDVGPHGIVVLRDGNLGLVSRYSQTGTHGAIPVGNREVSPELQELVRSGRTEMTYTSAQARDREKRTYHFRKFRDYPFYVGVGLATRDYLAPWRKELIEFPILVGLFALVTSWGAWLLTGSWRRQSEARLRSLMEQEGQRARTAQEALYHISEAAQASSSLQDLFRRIHGILAGLIPAQNLWVALVDPGTGDLGFPYFVDEQEPVPPPRGSWAQGFAQRVLKEGRPCLLSPEPFDPALAAERPGNWLGVPLQARDRTFGVLAVKTGSGALGHTAQDVDLLQYVSAQVAASIDRKANEEDRHQLLVELHHRQKLDSIGSLAGGVAHDMNNVLGAILGVASFLQETHASDPTLVKHLDTILRGGTRGRDLVKNLTDFARKGIEDPIAMDLNETVRREVELLAHTTLQKVRLDMDLEPALPRLVGDPSAIGGCLMNLAVNAVDAMPQGGTLTFRTRSLAKEWVQLEVSDTGHGMPPEVAEKAMDPFFTTKPVGKGTGLGLSMVYGTMRAHGGSVQLRSEPGKGTTILLRFPFPAGVPAPVVSQ